MLKITIYSVGKTKEPWLQEAIETYAKRLKSTLIIEWILAKTNLQLKQLVAKEPYFIAMDPAGKHYTSEELSSFLMEKFEKHHSRICFVIGGAEGIPTKIKNRATHALSLSKLTFTHQITRLILIEQLYRAFEIARGSQYHK